MNMKRHPAVADLVEREGQEKMKVGEQEGTDKVEKGETGPWGEKGQAEKKNVRNGLI